LTKIATGEYVTELLVNGQIYTFGDTPYEGISGDGVPPQPIDVPAGTSFIDVEGGLHQSVAIDTTGHVWTWGGNEFAEIGNGQDNGPETGVLPFQIQQDDKGNPFDNVVQVIAGDEMNAAIKSDGTVWVWGGCGPATGSFTAGLTGDGTAGRDVVYPTQVPIPLPSGVKITKMTIGNVALALASDDSVWVWGGGPNNPDGLGTGNNNYETPQKVPGLPSGIVDVASGGGSYNYVLTSTGDLWGWGQSGVYMGVVGSWTQGAIPDSSCWSPVSTPTLLTAAGVTGANAPYLPLPKPVAKIATDMISTHVILTDGTLWSWGDDAQGAVGDGHELNFAETKLPYQWDWGPCEMMVTKPVQIAASVAEGFTTMFTNPVADFYVYVQTPSGALYSWGRNKTGDLGSGVVPINSEEAGQYPNSWDVLTPQLVDPMSVTKATGVESPYCVQNPTAGSCTCPNGMLGGC
jgi:alpha-tubulin suppressor-like RCC1 family protein